MQRETGPIEPGQSTERAIFLLLSLRWQTCVSPPEMTL